MHFQSSIQDFTSALSAAPARLHLVVRLFILTLVIININTNNQLECSSRPAGGAAATDSNSNRQEEAALIVNKTPSNPVSVEKQTQEQEREKEESTTGALINKFSNSPASNEEEEEEEEEEEVCVVESLRAAYLPLLVSSTPRTSASKTALAIVSTMPLEKEEKPVNNKQLVNNNNNNDIIIINQPDLNLQGEEDEAEFGAAPLLAFIHQRIGLKGRRGFNQTPLVLIITLGGAPLQPQPTQLPPSDHDFFTRLTDRNNNAADIAQEHALEDEKQERDGTLTGKLNYATAVDYINATNKAAYKNGGSWMSRLTKRSLRSRPKISRRILKKLSPTRVIIGAPVGTWAYLQIADHFNKTTSLNVSAGNNTATRSNSTV